MTPHATSTLSRAKQEGRWMTFALLLALTIVRACYPSAAQGTPSPAMKTPRRILFLGNSFTYYNGGLETHFRALAESATPPRTLILGKDREHETLHGTYLAATVIYATLFRVDPTGLSYRPPGISAEEAAFLQGIAWTTVKEWQVPLKQAELPPK